MKTLYDYMISIPDFPKEGIIFRDVTGILESADGIQLAIEQLQSQLDGLDFDVIAGAEARGFIFGMPLAYNLHKPFVPIRKKGKLPRETVSAEYELEYGTAAIEINKTAIKPGQRVVIIDDLLATGGTMHAAAKLVEQLGGEVIKLLFLIELVDLGGRQVLNDYPVDSIITYEGE